MKSFNFVTDCANTIPFIVGESLSSSLVLLRDLWVGSIAHQLNTAMKHVMEAEESMKSRIASDITIVNNIVRFFKHGAWNSTLLTRIALLQEVDTRFGTTFVAAEQFLKSFEDVEKIIMEKRRPNSVNALDEKFKEKIGEGVVLPVVKELVKGFGPVFHVQGALEADCNPTMKTFLPMLINLKN